MTLSSARLHYLSAGSGAPIVFVHSFPEFSGAWEPQLRGLEFVPGVDVQRLPDSTHWIAQEFPDQANRLIREFHRA